MGLPSVDNPSLPYHQPAALCRTLVFQWAGQMVFSMRFEHAIINGLVDKNSPDLPTVKAIHGSRQTRAYGAPNLNSPVNTIAQGRLVQATAAPLDGIKFHGVCVHEEKTIQNQNASKVIASDLVNDSWEQKKLRQMAWAISMHYSYPDPLKDGSGDVKMKLKSALSGNTEIPVRKNAQGNWVRRDNGQVVGPLDIEPMMSKDSAHTVGAFFSHGPKEDTLFKKHLGGVVRPASARFFDPNVGTWILDSLTDVCAFLRQEWLPRFLDGTIRPDPGHDNKGRRELNFYRLVRFVQD